MGSVQDRGLLWVVSGTEYGEEFDWVVSGTEDREDWEVSWRVDHAEFD